MTLLTVLDVRVEGGKSFMDSVQAHSPFTAATFWQHVAVEEFWFADAERANEFFEGVPKLGGLLWEGSAGSYALAGEPRLVFEKDEGRI